MPNLPGVLLLAVAASAQPLRTAVLVGRGDVLQPFQSTGRECALQPSAAGSLVPWSGLRFLNVSFNFSGGGWTCGAQPADAGTSVARVPTQHSLSFSAFAPAGGSNAGVTIGVTDSAGNGFGQGVSIAPGAGWRNFSINLTTAAFWPNGRNVTLPITTFSLSASNAGNDTGWLGLADVAIVSGAAPDAIGDPVLHLLDQPRRDVAGVLVAGGGEAPVALGSIVVNRLPVPCAVSATAEMRNATGNMGQGAGGFGGWEACATAPPVLGPWQSVALSCVVDPATSPPGWVTARGVLSAVGCGAAGGAVYPSVVEGAVVVALPQAPAPPAIARNVAPGVFGGQMLPSAAAAFRIGMRTVREAPLWRWNQPRECWTPDCFQWEDYDGILDDARAGLEVMICARELAPPWACARNDSGGAWSGIPGPDHYADYVRWLTVMLDRYGPFATGVEVSNENDGYAYFASDKLPLDYAINLSVALVNMTAAAVAAAGGAAGLPLFGLSSSMFDVGQTGNGGSRYLFYEDAVLSAPSVMAQLSATTFHTYAQGVWVPWLSQPWGNTTFYYPNQTTGGWATNSTVAEIVVMARLLRAKAAAAGLPPDYAPLMRPSEMGYNLLLRNAAASGWTVMHAALVAHLLVHMRSLPVAAFVRKAFYFAAYDGCCVESDGYFGLWRPGFERRGGNATGDTEPTGWLPDVVPLAAVAAYATAAALVDVPSGRLPGVFVVDHSAQPAEPPYLPSCVAFETDPASPLAAPPLAVVMTTAHHFNDFLPVTLTVATGAPGAVVVRSGLGTPLDVALTAAAGGGVDVALDAVALPQYVLLPPDVTAAAVCATLLW